jgi:hypothetical protein
MTTSLLVPQITLWAGQLKAWCDLHYISRDTYEFRWSVGGEVFHADRGTLVRMLNKSQMWVDARIAEGFEETIESRNPHSWIA